MSTDSGVTDGARTRDLLDHNRVLCRLSYRHKAAGRIRTPNLCRTKGPLYLSSYGGKGRDRPPDSSTCERETR